jgi:GST-like protein
MDLKSYPHFERWFNEINKRPAVKRGLQVLTALRKPTFDSNAKKILFGHNPTQLPL